MELDPDLKALVDVLSNDDATSKETGAAMATIMAQLVQAQRNTANVQGEILTVLQSRLHSS